MTIQQPATASLQARLAGMMEQFFGGELSDPEKQKLHREITMTSWLLKYGGRIVRIKIDRR